MLMGISHDLKTPLTRMKLELEFCDDKDFESFFAVILPLKCLSFTKQKNDTLIYALLSF